jgi:hypothetical protein
MATAQEKKTIFIIDATTGESVERDLSIDELTELETLRVESELRNTEQQAKAAARESALAKLADLGLTAEEIAAL